MNANERMNVLANNGIDTSKFFNVKIDKNALEKGVVLKLDGDSLTASLADDYNKLREEIRNNGTVACTKLYRRWICAQMLRIQKGIAEGRYKNIEEYMQNFRFEYMRDVISDEIHAIRSIHKDNDLETFTERSTFFTVRTICDIYVAWTRDLEHKIKDAKIHIQNRNRFGAEKKEYIEIGNRNFYLDEAKQDVMELNRLQRMLSLSVTLPSGRTYASAERATKQMNQILEKYNHGRERIYNVPSHFMDAYKASGAYYTLKNLVLFHKCYLTNYQTDELLLGTEAFDYLKTYLDSMTYGEGYRLYALMKKCLKDNNVRLDNLF